jgi:hypothetical protein
VFSSDHKNNHEGHEGSKNTKTIPYEFFAIFVTFVVEIPLSWFKRRAFGGSRQRQ